MDEVATQNISNSPTKKEIIKDLKKYVEKVKMSKKKIEMNTKKLEEMKKIIYTNLLKSIESFLKNEKQMIIVLNNYKTHHALLITEACEYLNIKLIYLPSYSAKLNPIEQVWRTVKRELSTEFIESEEFLVDSFEKAYYKNVDKPSFTKNWVKKFINDVNSDFIIENMCLDAVIPV
ncbi:MAG: transposase [Methanobrevibacter sp.]|jgi:transposase|nr:transposase [Candidatus Methanovirga meridionalis]